MRIENILTLPPSLAFREIAQHRAEAVAQLTAARSRRDDLLLADGTDAAIAGFDTEADRLHLVLERLEAAEAALRNRQPLGTKTA